MKYFSLSLLLLLPTFCKNVNTQRWRSSDIWPTNPNFRPGPGSSGGPAMIQDLSPEECAALEPYYQSYKPLFGNDYFTWIYTERNSWLSYLSMNSFAYLHDPPSQFKNAAYFTNIVGMRPSASPGCMVLDVNIFAWLQQGQCYIAMVHGVLQMSCPPEHLPKEYWTLTLHPIKWDNQDWSGISPKGAGYMICSMRGGMSCQSGPALFLSTLTDETGIFYSSSYLIPDEILSPFD